jgi:hypothetical protein
MIPNIPVTQPVIHPRPEPPTHDHCGECGKTWKVPALEAHLTYDKAVAHGENEHPEVDARLNVKPGKGATAAAQKEKAELRAWARQKAAEAPPMSAEQVELVMGIFRNALLNRN